MENEQERLRTLNFPLHLERSRIALKEAIKPCKHHSLAHDAHCILLRVLMVTVDFIALERELGMPVSSIPTPLKVLHNKMDKERKEIRRLEKKLQGKTGSDAGTSLYSLAIPTENLADKQTDGRLEGNYPLSSTKGLGIGPRKEWRSEIVYDRPGEGHTNAQNRMGTRIK